MVLVLMHGATYAHEGSEGTARLIAEDACKSYISELGKDPGLRDSPDHLPIPSCSVLLATDSTLFVAVEFSDFWAPRFLDYEWPLLDTFGRAFDGVPYEGAVIFKSSWYTPKNGSAIRSNWSYDLHDLTFFWEEKQSGVRGDGEAVLGVTGSRHAGQTELHSAGKGSNSGAVVRMTPAAGDHQLLDLTSGSTWSVPKVDLTSCSTQVGDALFSIMTDKGAFLLNTSHQCSLSATFAGAW